MKADLRHSELAWNGHRFAWGSRTFVMAIINVTPDSFSGDGLEPLPDLAINKAVRAVESGADIIDIGGESTRPGHTIISAAEEIARVIPVIRSIAARVTVPVSVDTSKALVAEAALAAGASIINDVRGLTSDPDLASVAARAGCPVVIMHDAVPETGMDVLASLLRELDRRVNSALKAGILPARIIVDPGFGFGKDWLQNLEVLRRLPELQALGFPLLVGFSRKSTIGRVLNLPVHERLEGSLATTALAVAGGADIVRVHDVLENVRVARMADAVVRGVQE